MLRPELKRLEKKSIQIINFILKKVKIFLRHNETWEDMVQEIAIVNLNLEPEIKSIGVELLNKLSSNDKEIEQLLKILDTDDVNFYIINREK